MKKITLDVDALAVETFEMGQDFHSALGTVEGHLSPTCNTRQVCSCGGSACDGSCNGTCDSCEASCLGTCQTCAGQNTCDFSCGGSCGGATCDTCFGQATCFGNTSFDSCTGPI
jgi:hypothetical protein